MWALVTGHTFYSASPVLAALAIPSAHEKSPSGLRLTGFAGQSGQSVRLGFAMRLVPCQDSLGGIGLELFR